MSKIFNKINKKLTKEYCNRYSKEKNIKKEKKLILSFLTSEYGTKLLKEYLNHTELKIDLSYWKPKYHLKKYYRLDLCDGQIEQLEISNFNAKNKFYSGHTKVSSFCKTEAEMDTMLLFKTLKEAEVFYLENKIYE